MPSKKKNTTPDDTDSQNYIAIAVPFLVIGAALLFSEGTRAAGLPFFILGLTFFAIGQQETSKKPKK